MVCTSASACYEALVSARHILRAYLRQMQVICGACNKPRHLPAPLGIAAEREAFVRRSSELASRSSSEVWVSQRCSHCSNDQTSSATSAHHRWEAAVLGGRVSPSHRAVEGYRWEYRGKAEHSLVVQFASSMKNQMSPAGFEPTAPGLGILGAHTKNYLQPPHSVPFHPLCLISGEQTGPRSSSTALFVRRSRRGKGVGWPRCFGIGELAPDRDRFQTSFRCRRQQLALDTNVGVARDYCCNLAAPPRQRVRLAQVSPRPILGAAYPGQGRGSGGLLRSAKRQAKWRDPRGPESQKPTIQPARHGRLITSRRSAKVPPGPFG
jgi:hypothetical protein